LKIASLYEEYMERGCIGKSNTNSLPAPTDLTQNPYGKKNFGCNSKIGRDGCTRNFNRSATIVADF
jgi:hypothetical protein